MPQASVAASAMIRAPAARVYGIASVLRRIYAKELVRLEHYATRLQS